jgi:hypothetical protein
LFCALFSFNNPSLIGMNGWNDNMKKAVQILVCSTVLPLAGCTTGDADKVFLDRAPITSEAEDPIRFPEYFLMEGFELHDHGRIPRTSLIGAGMSVDLDLSAVRTGFSDVLYENQWETETMEIGRQSFRIIATYRLETVEIRGVQGTSGPTQIFLLYAP